MIMRPLPPLPIRPGGGLCSHRSALINVRGSGCSEPWELSIIPLGPSFCAEAHPRIDISTTKLRPEYIYWRRHRRRTRMVGLGQLG